MGVVVSVVVGVVAVGVGVVVDAVVGNAVVGVGGDCLLSSTTPLNLVRNS